ncbi:MAG: hypothetical protein ACXU93_04320 [Thermodesulfobacteriota bacterium]
MLFKYRVYPIIFYTLRLYALVILVAVVANKEAPLPTLPAYRQAGKEERNKVKADILIKRTHGSGPPR